MFSAYALKLLPHAPGAIELRYQWWSIWRVFVFFIQRLDRADADSASLLSDIETRKGDTEGKIAVALKKNQAQMFVDLLMVVCMSMHNISVLSVQEFPLWRYDLILGLYLFEIIKNLNIEII